MFGARRRNPFRSEGVTIVTGGVYQAGVMHEESENFVVFVFVECAVPVERPESVRA